MKKNGGYVNNGGQSVIYIVQKWGRLLMWNPLCEAVGVMFKR